MPLVGAQKLTYYNENNPLKVVYPIFSKELEENKPMPKKRLNYFTGGMLLPGRHGSSSDYRYGFQSQEIDPEIKGEGNSVNYKYRMYDPRIVRFFATDPLEYKFPYYSPYQFSSNSPIMAVELEGLESSVRINYNEGSINITRNANNQMTVTKSQLAPALGSAYHSSGGTTNDLNPGGQYEVWCSDCAVYGTGGAWTTLSIPKQQVVQSQQIQVQVPVTTLGTPAVDPTYDRDDKSMPMIPQFPNGYNDPTNLDHVKRNADASIGIVGYRADRVGEIGKDDPNVSAKITSIDVVAKNSGNFTPAVKKSLEDKYGVPVNVSFDGSMASQFEFTVNYQVKTQTSAGTPATPPTTVMQTQTQTVQTTVSPVVVTP